MIAKTFFATTLLFASAAIAQDTAEISLTVDGAELPVSLGSSSAVSGTATYASPYVILMHRGEGADEGKLVMAAVAIETIQGNISHVEARLTRQQGDEQLPPRFCYDEPERGGLTVELNAFEKDGDDWTVKGRFSCVFGSTENFGRDIDLSDGIEVTGTFDVTLKQEE